jgi:hypothetical protein
LSGEFNFEKYDYCLGHCAGLGIINDSGGKKECVFEAAACTNIKVLEREQKDPSVALFGCE